MYIFKDIAALSTYRKHKILARLRARDPNIQDIDAEYVHFVHAAELSDADHEQLRTLLTYGSPYEGDCSGATCMVTPRIGTISSWSSKATEIAHKSGLLHVERIERAIMYYISSVDESTIETVYSELHDRMTESILSSEAEAHVLFASTTPKPLETIDIITGGKPALSAANTQFGLALADDEIEYLVKSYKHMDRNPSDVELMMFAQINSEHCRHKVFNASWKIDGKDQPKSLFTMIKNTYEKGGEHVLSAYSDNAAVIKGYEADRFFADPVTNTYQKHTEPVHLVTKVETHNHPTAIAPSPGAATGVGGEIRDEGATGRGAKPKMGLSGFSVSNLRLESLPMPWETKHDSPSRISTPLQIMLAAPIGAAAFNNEFGRPNLAGYFRTYEQVADGETWGYHKPIMLAGGLGSIRDEHVQKQTLSAGDVIIVLGGPAMLIGLGGGAASSMQTGQSSQALDFASVQRANAEMERRVQDVINACWSLGVKNPIVSIHDVGAGGLSNALPELVHDSGLGAIFELRDVPNAEPGMSPLEIWCNEAQERYVVGINKASLELFRSLCARENCPFAVVGHATSQQDLIVTDRHFHNRPVELPMSVLFGKAPKMERAFTTASVSLPALQLDTISVAEAVERVLHIPSVGSKKFLITIGDRTVGGLTIRDQMVGPWQVPVSNVAVTASSFGSDSGEAMAIGERTPLAIIDAAAAARMAIAESLTNIVCAPIASLSQVSLSANWMAAVGHGNQDQSLYEAVTAAGESFCPDLGLTIPVGKDSLSMRTKWQDNGVEKSVVSPVSLIISAFAPVTDTSRVLTPLLNTRLETSLIFIDLGQGKNRLGGSALAQAYRQVGAVAPDIKSDLIRAFFITIQALNAQGKLLAYHDRSDGGLVTTLLEMAFASRCGLAIDLEALPGSDLDQLFNEELGCVIQIRSSDKTEIIELLAKSLGTISYDIGSPSPDQTIRFSNGTRDVYTHTRSVLESWWSDTSYHIQKLRDNPECAQQEYAAISAVNDPGLSPHLSYSLDTSPTYTSRPKVAICREQGVNGQVEMAAAFYEAGFEAVDVHINDIITKKVSLSDFSVLAACGGFSYGDVLGAGSGWAKTILNNPHLCDEFSEFFAREDTLTLGVCNGCQMLSGLKDLIPGASHWPKLQRNISEQFEARLVGVTVERSPSIFLRDMEGSVLPVVVAHGEGRMEWNTTADEYVGLRYVDNSGKVTTSYPYNPNGSKDGATAVCSTDGRVTILMPHPERGFLTSQYSWHPDDWQKYGPWFKLFQNARDWIQ